MAAVGDNVSVSRDDLRLVLESLRDTETLPENVQTVFAWQRLVKATQAKASS